MELTFFMSIKYSFYRGNSGINRGNIEKDLPYDKN